jgi:hypothetical protein
MDFTSLHFLFLQVSASSNIHGTTRRFPGKPDWQFSRTQNPRGLIKVPASGCRVNIIVLHLSSAEIPFCGWSLFGKS